MLDLSQAFSVPCPLLPLHHGIAQLRTSGEHLARGALQSIFLGTMRTKNLGSQLPALSSVCGLAVAQMAEFSRGCCQDFNLEK